jgi:hypothetical protein
MTIWWSQNYWGGGVAMLGGALLGAAALRAAKAPRSAWGFILGIGLAILANSRPLEGLITAVIVSAWLTWRAFTTSSLRVHLLRTLVPALIVLAPTFAFMLHYNRTVTGSGATLPYKLHQKQYMIAPLFYYQHPAAVQPTYHHQVFYDFHAREELKEYQDAVGSFDHAPAAGAVAEKWWTTAKDFVSMPPLAALLIGAIVVACVQRNGAATRLAWIVCIAFPLTHVLLTPWFRPAYLSVAMGFFAVLLVVGMRRVAAWRAPWGAMIVRFVVIVQLASWVMWARALNRLGRPPFSIARAGVLSELQSQEGKHLVLVRYGPRHSALYDWVANGADIDNSKVVFARSMGDAKDRELIDYFKDRKVWPLDFDENREPQVRRFNPGEWP